MHLIFIMNFIHNILTNMFRPKYRPKHVGSVVYHTTNINTSPTRWTNPLAPNDVYISRTAQLTSRRCILNIYSTHVLTEYFKHAAYSPFFSLEDAVYFIMLSFFGSCNIHILITECAKILKKIPAPKG